jgi:glycosyltransferase involved in cell wall biosynthesis
MTPRISIVMPCHNAADTVERAIESIRAQTLHDWELLLFDDGSSDGAGEILQHWTRRDDRLRTITSEHVGIVEALRLACAEARAPYLARMDADDVAYPQRLEKQWTYLEARPGMACCGTRVRIVGEDIGSGRRRYEGWINSLVTPESIERELFVECPLAHPTFLFRRAAYDAVGGYKDCGGPEDYDLLLRFWQGGYALGKVDETLFEWCDTPGRLSMSDVRYSDAAFRALKRRYLFETYLKDRYVFHQWGAGEVGKRWLKEWGERRPISVADIHPRKLGRRIHGYRVISPEELPTPGATFLLVMVGARGARDDIRAWLEPRGYRELRDYLFLA